MFQTYIVYGGCCLLLMLLSRVSSKVFLINRYTSTHTFDICMLCGILIFTLVFGLRYDVGVDYLNYLDIYQYLDVDRFELLFKYLVIFLAENNFHFSVLFSILAFLQIFFFIYAFKCEKFLYPSLVYVLFCGQYFLLWMNVIRQDLATCILIFSINFIVSKKFVAYLCCCILAFGFHKSAILFLLFYPFFKNGADYFRKRYLSFLYMGVAFLVFFSQINLLSIFDSEIVNLVALLDLDEYKFMDFEANFSARDLGFSFLSSLLIDILLVSYSTPMKQYYNSKKFIICYNLYMFGAIANLAVLNSFLLARPFRHFSFFKLIVAAYLLYYLYMHGDKKMNVFFFILLICLYFLLFLAIPFYSPDSKMIYNTIYNL